MTTFVLDASVTLAWAFADEASPYANEVIGSLDNRAASIPFIWKLEMTNALLVAIRRGRIERAGALRLIGVLDRLPLRIDQEPPRTTFDLGILDLGFAHNLSAYDASYLDLALRRSLPLATLDSRLATAADAVGVEIFRP